MLAALRPLPIGVTCAVAAMIVAAPSGAQQSSAPLDTAGVVVPATPDGFVNDYAHVLSAADVATLDTIVREVRARSRGEIAVVTVPSLAGHSARGVAVKYGSTWGVGYRGAPGDPANGTGVVVLLAPTDRQVFIATSEGARTFLTDEKATIIAQVMTPAFMRQQYGTGLLVGVREIASEYGRQFHFTPTAALPKLSFGNGDSTTGPAAHARVTYSWWVDATFTPTGSSVEGIPARAIDPTWRRVSVLSRSVLPPDAAKDPAALADSSVTFAVDGDFNRDGHPDRALVGTYQTNDGTLGRFFLILTRRRGSWAKAFVATIPGSPGFGAISRDGDHLLWWTCMDCDSYDAIAWTGRTYDFVPTPDDDQ